MKKWVSSFVLLCASLSALDKVDLLILDGTVVTMDPLRSVLEEGAVAIDGGEILAIGTKEEILGRFSAEEIIDASGKAIIPGLINGHTHIPMTLFRGLADDLDLTEWLTKYIFPAEAKNLNEQFVRASSRLGLAEMIRGGVTTIVDMYFFENFVAEEAAKAGMRGIFGQGVIDFPTPECDTFEIALQKVEEMIDRWLGHPLITPAIAPHAPYTVSKEHLLAVSELGKRRGVPILIHVSETESEVSQMESLTGHSPVSYLDEMGFFDSHVIAAHIAFPRAEDLATIKKRNVGVIHNPESNMKLASGIAPVPQMLLAEIALGLGTDGAASNNDLSLWGEMNTAAKLHKVALKDPKAVSAKEAFEMATIGCAKALRMEDKIGSIEVGKHADIAIVNLDGLHQIPSYNIYSTLIYATNAADVSTVIIGGQVVMRDRKLLTLDEKSIQKETAVFRESIKKSLTL